MSHSTRDAAARSVLSSIPIVMRTVGRAMRESGIEVSPPQHRLLGFLAKRPHTLSEVARIQGVTPATATTVVTTLENRGWVRRATDNEDRRRVVVSLTDEGLRALESAQSVAVAAVAMLLEPLKPDELDSLVRGIEILHGLGAPDSEICR